jgi:hypothetical protein
MGFWITSLTNYCGEMELFTVTGTSRGGVPVPVRVQRAEPKRNVRTWSNRCAAAGGLQQHRNQQADLNQIAFGVHNISTG